MDKITGLSHDIRQRECLLVSAPSLAVHISFVHVAIENFNRTPRR